MRFCRPAVLLLLAVAALPVLLHATDYAVANGALARVSGGGDPPITVGAGWASTTQTPPAFFWGANPAFNAEGPFTFSITGSTLLNVTDDFCPGDQFRVYDFGVSIGDTPPVAISYFCPELGPAAASLNPAYSHRTFVLGSGSHSITIKTITNPFGGGRAYLRVDSFSGSTDLLDPISQLLNSSGTGIIADPLNPTFVSNSVIPRLGVAADGAAKLVVRFNAPSAGVVFFSLVDQTGQALFGADENGYLTNLQGSPITGLTAISTTATNIGSKAFAVYTAPSDFIRANSSDATASQRQVFIQTRFVSGNSVIQQQTAILVVRPLILLVHGIWSDETAWANFNPFVALGTGNQQRYRIRYAVYPGANGFETDAAFVLGELKSYLRTYRSDLHIATVQADVMTHSMGANVVRTTALSSKFLNDPNFPTFGLGPVHRLITIAGVHLGTQMANRLVADSCTQQVFSTLLQKPTDLGAVADLAEGSSAMNLINAVVPPFSVHKIVGLADQNQKQASSSLFSLLQQFCPQTTLTSFDVILGPENDLMVTATSQRAGSNQAFTTFNDVVHSPPFGPGPTELMSSDISTWVVVLFSVKASATSNFGPLR